jgi:PAS domain S-box-containing protein
MEMPASYCGDENRSLKVAEYLLNLARGTTPIGGWSLELPDEALVWSDEACAIHDVHPGIHLTLEQAIEFYLPEHREIIRGALAACRRCGIPFDCELEILTAKGRHSWIRAVGEAETDKSGQIIRLHGAVQDISQWKRAEHEARALAGRLHTTLESITDAFFTVDRNWRFTYMNSEAERLLLRKRDELLTRTLWDEFPQVIDSEFGAAYRRAMKENVKVGIEAHYEPYQKWFQVNAYPSSEGLAVYFQDITKERAAADLNRELNSRFEMLAKVTTDAMWEWDIDRDKQWWNDGIYKLFGYSGDGAEFGISDWMAKIYPDDKDRVINGFYGALRDGSETWRDEYRFIRNDGSIAHVQDYGFIVRDEAARATRVVGGMKDITEQRKVQQQLARAQRLDALGQLTGGVAHDLNNLLTIIIGNAEMLTQHVWDDTLLNQTKMIIAAARRGAEFINHLLAFSRRQVLAPQILDLGELISEMHSLLQRALGENIEVIVSHQAGLWLAQADRAQLESAILNLCINSRDAMPNGGKISVDLFNHKQCVDDGPFKAGDYVEARVSDPGTGMSEEVMAQAFEPFFTTKALTKGTGLGLSMVYGFVTQSGGYAKLSSRPGLGTIVKLYLPRAVC